MATFSGVYIPDNLLARAPVAAEKPRPSLGQVFAASAKNAYGQVRYGLPYAAEKLTNTLTPADEQFYKQGLADAQAQGDKAAPAQLSDVTSRKVGIGRFIAENFASSLPQMGAIAAGGLGGFALGGPVGAAVGAVAVDTPVFVGSNVGRAVQENGGLSSASAERSLLTAPLQAASDVYAERFIPGVGKMFGGFAEKGAGNFLRRTAASVTKAGGAEAVTEASQQVGERYAAGKPLTGSEAAGEYVNAAVTAFTVGGTLGLGGGLHNTRGKPSSEATIEDIAGDVDTGLGTAPPLALPAPPSQLALPAPDPSQPTVQQRADMVGDVRGNVAPNTATGLAGLAATPVADVAVAGDGTAFARPTASDLSTLTNLPVPGGAPAVAPSSVDLANASFANADRTRQIGDTVRDILANRTASSIPEALRAPTAAFDPQTALDAIRPSTSALALDAAGTDVPGGTIAGTTATPRLFVKESVEDLTKAISAKNAPADVKAHAESELASRYQEAAGEAPLTVDDFQTRLKDVKQGIRGSFTEKLTAADPTELTNKVYTELFENQNTAGNVVKLGQRLGIIDEKLEPTAKANAIEQERTAAAQAEVGPSTPVGTPIATAPADVSAAVAPVPVSAAVVDPTFSSKKLYRDAGISRVSPATTEAIGTPVSLEDAQQKVFAALANDTLDDKKKRGADAAVTQTEKIAQHMGLISNDDAREITPLGRQVFLASPEAQVESARVKEQQGLTGTAASAFDSGVQEMRSDTPSKASYKTFEDIAAHEKGRVWAKSILEQNTATQDQTRSVTERLGNAMSPKQLEQQSANNVLDSEGLRDIPDTDMVALRKMVRDGASTTEIGAAIEQVRGGQALFTQPDTVARAPSPGPVRGQPVFKEMNTQKRGPSKAQMRAELEEQLRTQNLRQAIKAQLLAKEITVSRAERLNNMLDEGKIDTVEGMVDPGIFSDAQQFSGPNADLDRVAAGRIASEVQYGKPLEQGPLDPNQRMERTTGLRSGNGMNDREMASYRKEYWKQKASRDAQQFHGSTGAGDIQFEQFIEGKTFEEAVQHMVDHPPSKAMGAIMKGVQKLMKAITAAGGHSFELHVVKPGDVIPNARFNNAGIRATTHLTKVPAVSAVYLKSVEMGPQAGTNYQLAAHEMIHAVTMQAIDWVSRNDVAGKTAIGRAVGDLNNLRNAIIAHFNGRARAGNLTPFEREYHDRNNNSLQSMDEVIAWGLTNPEMQAYLQTIQYGPKESVFSRFVNGIRDLLGLAGEKYDTALTELLRVSEQVFDASSRDLQSVFARDTAAGIAPTTLRADASQAGESAANRTVDASDKVIQGLSATLEKVSETIHGADLKRGTRKTALGWASANHLIRRYGHIMPAMVDYFMTGRAKTAIRGRFANIAESIVQGVAALKKTDPDNEVRLNKLMGLVTEFKVDPSKKFEAHTHLMESDRVEEYRQIHKDAVKLANDMRRGKGTGGEIGVGWKLFNEARAHNEMQNYARMATELHALVALDPELALGVEGAKVNPMETFMLRTDITGVRAVRDHWKGELDAQITAATAFVEQKKGEASTGTASDQRGMAEHLSPIEAKLAAIAEARAGMTRSPYFHLGRFGEHFGATRIAVGEDGKVDPKVQQKVALAFKEAGFGDMQLSPGNLRPSISSRFETKSEADQFHALATKLEAAGLLEKGSIQSGPREATNNYGAVDGTPGYVKRYIDSIKTSPMFTPDESLSSAERKNLKAQMDQMIRLAIDTHLDTLPDSAINKVLSARYTVPGYSPNMMRSFAHRANVGATSLGNISMAPRVDKAYTDMREQVRSSRSEGGDNRYITADLLEEIKKRDARVAVNPTGTTLDTLRTYSHAYFLGFSPAYGMINLSQLAVTGLPELAKTHGYGKSFRAMRQATPLALAVIRAAASEARGRGLAHAAELVLTDSALQKAGLTGKQVQFMRHMLATGSLDIGTAARALAQKAQHAGGNANDVILSYASAMGLYTETASRMIMALAAHDLHGGEVQESAKYASNAVSNSMFDYDSSNTARQLGRDGFVGKATPFVTQFMSYTAQLTEKLYSEAADAFGRPRVGESAEATAKRAKEARTWLVGHLTAVTALSGTLGLPVATAFAAALERMVGKDDEPYDATAAWRGWLAHLLGKDAAEVVSRGLPRAAGFDISARTGEADLLPFSKMLSDKRTWAQSIQAMAGRSLGAGSSMLLNIPDAGTKFGNGEIMAGMQAIVPIAFKGMFKSYQLNQHGYTDSRGNKLPITPGSAAILYSLLGFNTSENAEYSEARGDQRNRQLTLTQRSGVIRQQIIKAHQGGDATGMAEWARKAQAFDTANPAYAVLPGLMGAEKRQNKAQAQARQLRTPIGVGVKDLAGQRLTDYANANY